MTFLSPGFSAVSDLAPNSGMQVGAPPVISSHNLGGQIEDKAAFNNPPYAYGIVERTLSEYKSSPLSTTTGTTRPGPASVQHSRFTPFILILYDSAC